MATLFDATLQAPINPLAGAQMVVPKTTPLQFPVIPDKPITPTTETPAVEPTVLSSANITEKKLPEAKQQLDTLSQKGVIVGADGIKRYADGSMMEEPSASAETKDRIDVTTPLSQARQDSGTYTGTDGRQYYNYDATPVTTKAGDTTQYADTGAQDTQINELITSLRTSLDSSTKATIDAIHQQYEGLRRKQEDINKRYTAGVEQSLLMSGSARYAQLSSGGLVAESTTYGLQNIADLDAKENTAIAKARAAQQEGDFQLVSKQIDLINDVRKAKLSEAAKINEELAKRNAETSKLQQQASRDTAVASVMSAGITDPTEILSTLQAKGYTTITADDISKTLKNLSPDAKNVMDLMTTAKNNGAPADVVQKIGSARTLNYAFTAAGEWGRGGTGIIGEYNAYKAQATAAGQAPLTFSEYQTADANRKAKVAAAANAAGLTTAGINTALKLSDDYEQRSKDFYTVRDSYNRIRASAKNPSAAGDMALLFSYMKILDPNSVVRETEYATAQNAGSIPERIRAAYNSAVDGQKLSEAQRNDFVDRADRLFSTAKKQQDSISDEFKKRAEKYSVPSDLVVRETGAIGTEIIQGEDDAKNAVIDYGKNNPDKQEQISQLATETNPDTGNPYTYSEIQQILGIEE